MFNLTFIGTIHGSFQYNRYNNVLTRVEHDTTLIDYLQNVPLTTMFDNSPTKGSHNTMIGITCQKNGLQGNKICYWMIFFVGFTNEEHYYLHHLLRINYGPNSFDNL
jgi:hypothetical protein